MQKIDAKKLMQKIATKMRKIYLKQTKKNC